MGVKTCVKVTNIWIFCVHLFEMELFSLEEDDCHEMFIVQTLKLDKKDNEEVVNNGNLGDPLDFTLPIRSLV